MLNEEYSDIATEELHPTVLYCSRIRDARLNSYHSHTNIEMAFVLSGTGRYLVDGVSYDVRQGDLIICNPGVMHQSIVTDPNDPTIEFVIGFTDVHFLDMPDNKILLPGGEHLLRLSSEAKKEINRCCYEIMEENNSAEPGRYYMIQAEMTKMLILIFRAINGSERSENPGIRFESYSKGYVVQQIIRYMNENYANKITLDQIAKNMFLSSVYISKIFKEKTGDSPINYLIRIRLQKAKELLEDGHGNIKSIASMVGYDDVYHFSKIFKKYYGESPLNYQKRFRQEEEPED